MPAPDDNTNALTHGLTARLPVAPGEDPTAFEIFSRFWQDELKPKGTLEEFLAHRIAAAAWRLLRVAHLEGSLASKPLSELLANQGKPRESTWDAPDPHLYDGLAKLARHEAGIERGFYRALRELRTIQDERR